MKINLNHKSQLWINLIFVSGIGYLAILQCLIPDGAFFSGDSGLKAMLSQNLAVNHFMFNLEFPAQSWIKDLWAEGLFPYNEPYVYHLSGKYFITFPFTFPLVTSPFYYLLGYRGFYVIPLASTLMIWFVFYKLSKQLDINPNISKIGLTFLIFASNLTVYSAIYWEHTLSVCLSFAGISLIIPHNFSKKITFWLSIWAGVLSSLAVWFRPEQIFLVIFLDLLSLLAIIKGHLNLRSAMSVSLNKIFNYINGLGWIYLVTSSLTLLIYGVLNYLIYKNPFGVHAIQVIEHQTLLERFIDAVRNLQLITIGYYSFFIYFPIALFPLLYLFFSWIKPTQVNLKPEWIIWYIFCLIFIIGVSASVPAGAGGKQWGPRFLLVLEPIILLLFSWQLDCLLKNQGNANKIITRAGLAMVLIFGVLGIVKNSIHGANFINNTYAQIEPAVEKLRSDSDSIIAISDQFIGQVLQPALSRDVAFMWVADKEKLARLNEALFDHNLNTFTYICYTGECKLFSLKDDEQRVKHNGVIYFLKIVRSGEYGKYTILDVQFTRNH